MAYRAYFIETKLLSCRKPMRYTTIVLTVQAIHSLADSLRNFLYYTSVTSSK